MSTTHDALRSGLLAEALAAQTAEVKRRPTDVDARGLLVEVLCLAGELERADAQLETIVAQATDRTHGAALLRQLVRAERWRRQFWSEGRVPELTAAPGAQVKLALEASIRLRERAFDAAGALYAQAEELRAPLRGLCDGEAFDDLRDLDDRLGGLLEVLTSTGKYFWIALEQVESLEFDAPERPVDLLWRSARISVRSGPEGAVFVPALYAPDEGASDAHKLGRATDWVALGTQGAMRGLGQRTLLVGERDVPLLEVGRIEIAGRAG